jgi:hypothetical protein
MSQEEQLSFEISRRLGVKDLQVSLEVESLEDTGTQSERCTRLLSRVVL